jgi:hypothetical protein
MGPKAGLDLGKRKLFCPCRETNLTGLVNITVTVTCSGMEKGGSAYRILRGHLNDWECETMTYFVRTRGEWNSFRIVGRRCKISWKCWQMNLNVEAILLPVTSLSAEIHRWLPVANRSSVGLRKQLKSHCTVISTRIKLYTTFTRRFVLCGCETWAINKSDENNIRVFERSFEECIWPNKGNWRMAI